MKRNKARYACINLVKLSVVTIDGAQVSCHFDSVRQLYCSFKISFSLHVRLPKHEFILHYLCLDRRFPDRIQAARLQVTRGLGWLDGTTAPSLSVEIFFSA